MANWDAGIITTNGIEVPVTVEDINGQWQATYGGQHLAADTRDKLKAKLARLTRVARTEIEVRIVKVESSSHSGRVTRRRGTITGKHGANGNVLVTWDDTDRNGKQIKEQLSRYGGGGLYLAGDVTDEEIAQYGQLRVAQAEADEAVRTWVKAREISPSDTADRAINAHLGGQGGE